MELKSSFLYAIFFTVRFEAFIQENFKPNMNNFAVMLITEKKIMYVLQFKNGIENEYSYLNEQTS